jgi:hypothetical protein
MSGNTREANRRTERDITRLQHFERRMYKLTERMKQLEETEWWSRAALCAWGYDRVWLDDPLLERRVTTPIIFYVCK